MCPAQALQPGSQGPACLSTGHRLLGRNPGQPAGGRPWRSAPEASTDAAAGAQGLRARLVGPEGPPPAWGPRSQWPRSQRTFPQNLTPGTPPQGRPPTLSRHSPCEHLTGPSSAPHPLLGASQVAAVGESLPADAGDVRDAGSIPGLGGSPGEGIGYPLQYSWAPLVVQTLKHPPAMRETLVRSLGWEDPLEKVKANHSSILAWRIPTDRRAWWATVHGVAESDTTATEHTQSPQAMPQDRAPAQGPQTLSLQAWGREGVQGELGE